MLVEFIGDPNETARGGGLSRTSLDVGGRNFRMGEVVDASDMPGAVQAKLRTNPHFKVVESVSVGGAEVIESEASDEAEDADETTAPSQRKRRRIA